MKRISIPAVSKWLFLFVFICAQVKVWAEDAITATTMNTINKKTNVFTDHWVLIAVGILCLFVSFTVLTSNRKNKRMVSKTSTIKEERFA